jgi:hypothetical protein
MKIKLILYLILASLLLTSCNTKSENVNSETNSINSYSTEDENSNEETEYSDSENNDETLENSSICKYEDGTYSATVDYHNPETGYSATYTLDVDVEDCQVTQINFPNDGYLDEDHISYADIDEDGRASVDGEEGKTYNIQIDN